MQVFNVWAAGKVNTLLVCPGTDHPENSNWREKVLINGEHISVPKKISVRFVNGIAEVDKELGRYLIDKGHAYKERQPEVSGVHSGLLVAVHTDDGKQFVPPVGRLTNYA